MIDFRTRAHNLSFPSINKYPIKGEKNHIDSILTESILSLPFPILI